MAFKKGAVDYDDIVNNTRQTRKVKYFIQFEGKTIQPQNIERIFVDQPVPWLKPHLPGGAPPVAGPNLIQLL